MEYEQHFLNGFVKQAAQHDIKASVALDFLKQAVLGPNVELASFGAPSLIGYLLGRSGENDRTMTMSAAAKDEAAFKQKLQERLDADQHSGIGHALRFLAVPGYTGYRIGKSSGRQAALAQLLAQKAKNPDNTNDGQK
jgi:hypothetical protein